MKNTRRAPRRITGRKASTTQTKRTTNTSRVAIATAQVHVGTRLARAVCNKKGLSWTLSAYNTFRRTAGYSPIKATTIKRYTGSGDGYRNGPPALFVEFLLSIV